MYEGLSTPSAAADRAELVPRLAPRSSEPELPIAVAGVAGVAGRSAAASVASSGGHGALRDDDDDSSSANSYQLPIGGLSLRPSSRPSGLSDGNIGNFIDMSLPAHGQPMPTPSQVRGSVASSANSRSIVRRAPGPMGRALPSASSKKRSFYQKTNLRGREPPVPAHLLGGKFRNNSFFARRLLRVGWPLCLLLATGLGFYYFYKPHSLVIGADPNSYGFMLSSPSAVYSFQATACENMVGYSALVYHALPAVLLLLLPGSGVRAFEPFQRTPPLDADGNVNKIKRTFVFQICELVAVLVVIFAVVVVMFFLYMFFNGGAFSCNIHAVQIFAIVAIIAFIGIFVELQCFARFREHVKMQLGAFQESDQTGDIRNHVVSETSSWLDTIMQSDKTDQVLAGLRKRLYKCAKLGDTREMRELLTLARNKKLHEQRGFPAKCYEAPKIYLRLFGKSKKNPMHVAAYHGNIPAMELLHRAGFEVDALDKFSRVRFSTGDLFWYFAHFFVGKPAGVSSEDTAVSIFRTTLVTPLHCAVSTGQIEAVQWLIAHGANVDARAKSSYRSDRVPPMFLSEHADVVHELLVNGADLLEVPDPGFMNTLTVLQLAYLRGNYAVAQELEEWGGDVALTPFHAAAARNDVIRVRKYIRRKVDLDCLGEHGYVGIHRRTPLHWAAVNGSVDAAAILLEAGADPNFQDARGRSPLHWAARRNRLEVVNLLLQAGADPNLVDEDYMTPVMCAAFALDVSRELFSSLVGTGADINYQLPTTGDTALHLAVSEDNEASALAILACGGSLMKMNMEGLRALDCTTSTKLLFEVKRAAGHRDVMISYTHSHAEFAKKLRKSLERANVTTWLDLMDPSGIGGGSVWREEIARGITNAALVVCILTEDYAQSEWCLKELALAKQVGTPILAVSTEGVRIGEELQVYLYTRQIIPFEPSITTVNKENARQIEYEYDDTKYESQFRLLLDGVRDEIEKRRNAAVQKQAKANANGTASAASSFIGQGNGFSSLFQPWEVVDGSGTVAPFVFISHGDKHATFVQQLYSELTEAGLVCYGDRNVEGQDFEDRIHAAQDAIQKCACFIVVLSAKTMASELVRDQLAFAEDKTRPIFPVVLNELEPGLDKRYSLARNELFHFMANGMSFKPSAERLAAGLRRYIRVIDNGSRIASANTSFVSFTQPGGYDMNMATTRTYDSSNSGSFVSFIDSNTGTGTHYNALMSALHGSSNNVMDSNTANGVIFENAEVYDVSGEQEGEVVEGREHRHSSIRNFESISALEDENGRIVDVDLSATRVRM